VIDVAVVLSWAGKRFPGTEVHIPFCVGVVSVV